MDRATRRELLAVGSAGVVTAFAGCNGNSGGNPGNSSDGNTSDGETDSSDGEDEPAEPSITIVSPEEGAVLPANEFVEFEMEVKNFELRQTDINPDSVSGRGGYIIISTVVPGAISVEDRIFEEGETAEPEVGTTVIEDGTNSAVHSLGTEEEYKVTAQLINTDDTATQYYDIIDLESS